MISLLALGLELILTEAPPPCVTSWLTPLFGLDLPTLLKVHSNGFIYLHITDSS